MAYPEKVYKVRNGKKTKSFTYRSRYLKPDGTTGSQPGFPTAVTAKRWGDEQEAAIRAGTWVDPDKMKSPFGTFARTFMEARQKRGRTMTTRWGLLEQHIFPKWEHVPLNGITWFEVDSWQLGIKDGTKAGHCVSLMSTILTAAVDAGYLPANPLVGRRRTRPTVLTVDEQDTDAAKEAPSPEAVVLGAERMGPVNGLHVLTTAFTGMNWGEGTGLHRDYALLTRRQQYEGGWWECPIIRVRQELAEYTERAPDGSKGAHGLRIEPVKNTYRKRDIDLPPFLAALMRAHLDQWPHEWVFATANGKLWRNSNFTRRYLRPAFDGRPALERTQGRTARDGWEAIDPAITMRSLRHLHDSLQDEIGVRTALQYEQAGHKRPGIKAVYQHPTVPMRQVRLAGLQAVFVRTMNALGKRNLWGVEVDLSLPEAPTELIS
jgi:hypothetical protein